MKKSPEAKDTGSGIARDSVYEQWEVVGTFSLKDRIRNDYFRASIRVVGHGMTGVCGEPDPGPFWV